MVNWGIAGCGWVARDYVGPAMQASQGRIAALYDPDSTSRDRAAALFGAPAYADLPEFLATPGLGAVYVAAPNHAHRALVEAAAAAGVPVLCEKPMATNLADAEAMVAACARAGVLYGTAFDQRFHAAHQKLAGLVASGQLGTVIAVRIVYACWLPADWAGDNWRIDPGRAGGGALMDLAPHGLDLASFLLGEALVDVAAMGQSRVHDYEVEDGALLMARSQSGVLVQLHVAYNCPETLPRRRLEVIGTSGQCVAVDTMGQTPGGTLTFTDAATGQSGEVPVPGAARSPFLNQVEAFAAAVEGGPNPFSGAHDLSIMALVLRAQAMAVPDFSLSPREREQTPMTHVLPPNMPDAAAAYVESMPEGRVELFSLSALDRTGVSCWNAIFLNQDGTRWHGVAPHGVGYGVDDAGAIIGTTGELAEAVHSATEIHRTERRTSSYNALRAQVGARAVTDPLTLCLPAGSTVDGDTTLEWVPARRWPGGETVWMPIDIAACSVGDLSPGYEPFTTPITNGLGAGPTLDFAIGHGLCELLQRDGNGVGFRAMDRGIALDMGDGPTDPRTRALLARLDDLGIEVIPKFATDEFGTANVYCVGAERDGTPAPYPIMVTAAGEAASLDREHALRKAVFEFAAARMRKVFSHAPLTEAAKVAPPGYLERFRAYHTLGGEESRSLSAMLDWLRLDQASLKGRLADTVLSRQGTHRFDALPTWDGPLAGTGLVEELARRFAAAGMEILYFDWSPPHAPGVHVVKAFVPGLEVETMSYHRIGERGVRKLLERGSPLVGLGTVPDGAAPVRLPPGAADRLGGAPWLDVAEVDRIVGGLYPLYREPEVHSAPISLETP